jgi:phytoene synthase
VLDRLIEAAEASAGDYFAHNSRSFSLAARLFPPAARHSVTSIYAFCRTTDDIVDLSVREGDLQAAGELIDRWEALARGAYSGRPTGIAFLDTAMAEAAAAGVPFELVAELIAGVRSDIGPVEIEDWDALRAYCFRVASVIGLWMTRLFGVSEPAMLRRAESLGFALQLTNILRDVGEDLAVDRIYLPREALERHGLSRADLEAMAAGAPTPPQYRALCEEMIAVAEGAYREAFEAMPHLPGFYARPVAVAAEIYRGIIGALRANGYDNFGRRATTGRAAKLALATRGLARLAAARLVAGRHVAGGRATVPGSLDRSISGGPGAARRAGRRPAGRPSGGRPSSAVPGPRPARARTVQRSR